MRLYYHSQMLTSHIHSIYLKLHSFRQPFAHHFRVIYLNGAMLLVCPDPDTCTHHIIRTLI